MAEAVLSFANGKLGSFITQELPLPGDVRSDMEWLLEEMEYIKDFLNDAETKQVDNQLVQQWVSDIAKIANDVVYVLEDFEFSEGQTGTSTTYLDRLRYFACIRTKEINVYDIGAKMNSLKERVEEISNRSGATSVLTRNEPERKSLRRSTLYTYSEPPLVGLEEVKLNLMDELLKDGNLHRCMVSIIYGESGSGKGTLVRGIYNSKEVLSSFTRRTWIHVTQEDSVLNVLRKVARSLKDTYTHEEAVLIHQWNVVQFEMYLRMAMRLEDRKYLLVIDDVWDIKVWESLKKAFLIHHHTHSRVIVTTRNKDLVVRMGERVYTHHLQSLNPNDSWELFLENVHKGESEGANWCSKAMQDVGRDIVTKCDGLPLAIVLLAGVLAHKKSLQEWETVRKLVLSHSIEISYLLNLSYDDLPSELKLCFLYVGVYPENFEIPAKMLMQSWMAEEFIKQGEEGEEMEDIAQSYLKELINRNLIQVSGVAHLQIDMCRIQAPVRNLAVRKAMEVNFLDIYSPASTRPPLVRRQVIHANIHRYISAPDHANIACLRSLIVFNPSKKKIKSASLVATLRKFSRLSFLFIELVKTPNKLLKVIGTLKQLKLLVLGTVTSTKIYLPSSIGNLRQLQTLLVTSGECYLPRKISELKNLRHLHCPGGLEGHTAEIGTLSNLQTLDVIRYEYWNPIQTQNLFNLRELSITGIKKQNWKAYSLESISKLKSLEMLNLVCTDNEMGFPALDFMFSLPKICRVSLFGKLRMLPSVEKWPQSISSLCLAFSLLEEDPIPKLAKLTKLIRLDLVETHESRVMCFPSQSFPQLKQLDLYGFSKLGMLELRDGALPIIKTLYITGCPELEDSNMPEKLKSILIQGPGGQGFFDQLYTTCHGYRQ